jgi:hypothetical protein
MSDEYPLHSTETKIQMGQLNLYVGYLELAHNFRVSLTKKPSKWALWWMKFLLGWVWRDIE